MAKFEKIESLIEDSVVKNDKNNMRRIVIGSLKVVKDAYQTILNYQKGRKPTKARLRSFIRSFIRGKGEGSVEGKLKRIFQTVTTDQSIKDDKGLLLTMQEEELVSIIFFYD